MDLLRASSSVWNVIAKTEDGPKVLACFGNAKDAIAFAEKVNGHMQVWKETQTSALIFSRENTK